MDNVTSEPGLSDEAVRDVMQWRENHKFNGKRGKQIITCERTLTGYKQIIAIPCCHYNSRTKKCMVHGTTEQPECCKRFLCDRAREALRVQRLSNNVEE
jgi:hypothetical protein